MTQEQLDLLVRLMREVVRREASPGAFSTLEETYAYQQCVRYLVKEPSK